MMNKQKMSRRDFLRLSAGITAAGVTGLLASCAPPAPEPEPEEGEPAAPPPPEEKVTIHWWHGWGGMTGTFAAQGFGFLQQTVV